jgi:Flp pilus assembly protein TadG
MIRFLALLQDCSGASAVEFALLSPLFGLLLAGTIDLSGVLYTKFRLDDSVAAGANYALINAANVNSGSGASVASTIGSIVSSGVAGNWANTTVIVNNGPTTAIAGAGTANISSSSSGTASNADSCYCPTLGSYGIAWGSAVACGSNCPTTSYAGKFVLISASRTYKPFFSNYGIVKNDTITTSAAVQVQ